MAKVTLKIPVFQQQPAKLSFIINNVLADKNICIKISGQESTKTQILFMIKFLKCDLALVVIIFTTLAVSGFWSPQTQPSQKLHFALSGYFLQHIGII